MGGDPPAPNPIGNMILGVEGLRWHGPIPVVEAPGRSDAMPSSLRDPLRGFPPGAVAPGDPCGSTGGGPLYFFNSLLVDRLDGPSVNQSLPGMWVVRLQHEQRHGRRRQSVPHQGPTEADLGD